MSDWRPVDDKAPLCELVRIKLDNDHETVGERVGQNLWMFDTTADWDDFTSEMVGWKPLPEGPPQPPAPVAITIFDGPDDLPWPPLGDDQRDTSKSAPSVSLTQARGASTS